jgi:hypothetical protein
VCGQCLGLLEMNEFLFVLVATVCSGQDTCDMYAIDSGLAHQECRASVGRLAPQHIAVLKDIGGRLVKVECIVEDVE